MIFGNLFSLGTQPNLVIDVFRNLFFFVDGIVYSLIPLVYSMMLNLYDIKILFKNGNELDTIVKNFSNTIYSFLAIVMFFRTAVSLLTMLVDPSKIDDKENGAKKIIKNIFLTLALIVAVPWAFSIAKNLQTRIMDEHIIEKMIIGDAFTENENYSLGNELALSSWSVFINLADGSNSSVSSAYNDVFNNANSTGLNSVWPLTKLYAVLNSTTGIPIVSDIIGKIFSDANRVLTSIGLGTHYQISYVWLISTIAGIYILSAFIKLLIDVAYRSIKFFILELLSPIAIVSYIDPGSSKKGLFSKWMKETLNTYLSLFIRVFVIAIATVLLRALDLSNIGGGNALVQKTGSTVGVKLIYVLALVAFIKNAPKFIDDLFGSSISKGSEAKLGHEMFSGILGAGVTATAGSISGAVAAKATGKSALKGAAMGAWSAGKKGYSAGKKGGLGGMVGVVGAGIGAVKDQNKKYGNEHDRERERLISNLEQRVPDVDKAKGAAVNDLFGNGEVNYKQILNNGRKVNGRTYGLELEDDDELKNTFKKLAGGLAKDEVLHADDEEYLKRRRLVADASQTEAIVARTYEKAKEDFSDASSKYSGSSDKAKYVSDFATQTAQMRYEKMNQSDLKVEYEKELRSNLDIRDNAIIRSFSTQSTSDKASELITKYGIDSATVSGMSEAQMIQEYTTRVKADSNNAISLALSNFDHISEKEKVTATTAVRASNIDTELSGMNEAGLDSRFNQENAERIQTKYGTSLGNMASDATKAKGDADTAKKGLEEYKKSAAGKRASDIDSAYSVADNNYKAKKFGSNNNGNNP